MPGRASARGAQGRWTVVARTRPLPLVLLALAAVGAVATAVSPAVQDRLDRPAREQALAVAQAVPAPDGATRSTDCRGEGLVACWETSGPVGDVARELSRTMGEQARVAATSTCGVQAPATPTTPGTTAGTDPSAGPGESCSVRVRFKAHGTWALVEPLLGRDERTGAATVVGSRVSLSAT